MSGHREALLAPATESSILKCQSLPINHEEAVEEEIGGRRQKEKKGVFLF